MPFDGVRTTAPPNQANPHAPRAPDAAHDDRWEAQYDQ